MNDQTKQLPLVYLKPGEAAVPERPAVVATVLGSCVSVVMFHQRLRVGGICHALLPCCPESGKCGGGECGERFRYVDCSVRWMLERFRGLEPGGNGFIVKLFGGSSLNNVPDAPGGLNVGLRNVETARELLARAGKMPMAIDVGGAVGRKILFYAHTGAVYVKRLGNFNGGRPVLPDEPEMIRPRLVKTA